MSSFKIELNTYQLLDPQIYNNTNDWDYSAKMNLSCMLLDRQGWQWTEHTLDWRSLSR